MTTGGIVVEWTDDQPGYADARQREIDDQAEARDAGMEAGRKGQSTAGRYETHMRAWLDGYRQGLAQYLTGQLRRLK